MVFDNESTNEIKGYYIYMMLCGHLIGIEKLEHLKLLQTDPLINEVEISMNEPDMVSRFWDLQLQDNTNVQRNQIQSL